MLRRVPHPGKWGVCFGVAVLLAAGAFLAGRLTAAPVRETLTAAQQAIPVTALVELRPVDSRSAYSARVEAAPSQALAPVLGGVVVRQELRPGDQLSAGQLIGVVAGNPIFGLTGPLALYRDLKPDDSGDDVTVLQHSLATAGFDVAPTGTVGPQTVRAIASMFRDAGYPAPKLIPHQQLIPLPASTVTITEVAAIGEQVSSEAPLARASFSAPTVTAMVDPVAADDFVVGGTVEANVGGTVMPLVVQSIGPFVEPSSDGPGGKELRLVPADGEAMLDEGSSATVFGPGERADALAVPLVAVRQDTEGSYLLVERVADGSPEDGPSEFARENVEVLRTGGGWAAIAEGVVGAGASILVSK